ncbi:MAG: family 78 glycoside hydrolase catalytic domain, partial [Bryocella sp.]
LLGAGWHGSPLLWIGAHTFTGPDSLRAQLVLTYADGSQKTVATDSSWMSSTSPIVMSEIYAGEAYDARLVEAGWNRNGFHASDWLPATVGEISSNVTVSAQPDQPVHFDMALHPISVKMVTSEGHKVAVYDMGQNMVGVVKLRVQGPRGTTVRLRFAERLNPDGTIYTENLRAADATDHYTLSGKGLETWEPSFTFHGFRYVEVSGYPGVAGLNAIEGEVWNSLTGAPTMTLTTSSQLLNKMDQLGLWGQRGNFLSIPTDCPQRDERMGWMGDAGAFWRTGSYNFDINAFSDKFMKDIVDAQSSDGAYSNISPNLLMSDAANPHDGHPGAPGWGDAGVLVPYATWLQYGNRSLIEANWKSMQAWMSFIETTNPNHLRRKELGANYADWLAPDPHTPKDLVATAYWALIAQEMSTMAHALGREDDAKKYHETFEQVRTAFQKAYIASDGMMRGDTQTDYVVALAMDLAPKDLEKNMTDRLVKNIADHNNHLTTGFLGTPYLLTALSKEGRDDVAYGLLLSDTYPSWGYMVAKGATTWWERWNGDTGDPSMNSYNHYAFGSVMAWVYRKTAAIDADPGDAGYHHVVIAPQMTNKLSHVKASYDSAYGMIKTEWSRTASGGVRLMVTVPPNATASVRLPAVAGSKVSMDGRAVKVGSHDGVIEQEIGSGTYSFTIAK